MERTPAQDEKGIIAWFAQNPVAANLLMVVILAAGLVAALGLRIEGFPSFDPTTITVDVFYESGDARQSEEGIAIKIEEALQGTTGLKDIRSTSTTRGATVSIERTSGYDLERLNNDVKNRVDGIFGFPEAAEKPVVSQQSWEQDALWISIYGDIDQHSLQGLARQFEVALLNLPSINKVVKSGWKTPEITIEVDEQTLQAHAMTLDEVARRVGGESLSETSGELRSRDGVILLKADRLRYHYQDFADIVVAVNPDGSTLRLSDIAIISDGFEETPNVRSRFQGKPAVNLEVRVDRNADIVALAADARQLVAEWKENRRLPQGVDITLWWDQSRSMLERLHLMLENGLIGILLVMLVLSVFLHPRVAFWVGMGLPVCFAGGLIMMSSGFFDLTLNQLTTFGFVLVLGILVDDAVIVGESVYTARRQHGDSLSSTLLGVKRVAVPTVFGVLTTIAAFFPLSFIAGELGTLFSQFALVCTACLLFSIIESKLILPAHLGHLNTRGSSAGRGPGRLLAGVQGTADTLLATLNTRIYQPAARAALHHRYATLCLFLAVFVLVVGLVPSGKIGFDFFPDIPGTAIDISYSVEQGGGYGVTHHQAAKIEAVVARLNRQWRAEHLGSGDVIERVRTLVADDENGFAALELSPEDQRAVDIATVATALREALKSSEGLHQLLVSTTSGDNEDLVLNLLAESQVELEDATQQVVRVLETLQGVDDIQHTLTAGQAQLRLELTPEGRARGMTTEHLARQIQQGFFGAEVQRVQRGKDEVKIRVRYPAEQRRDITNLQDVRVRTPDGDIMPLSTVVEVQSEYTVTKINRINGRRAATLSASIDESVVESGDVMEALEVSVFSTLREKYPHLQIIGDGETAEQEETGRSLRLIFATSLMLIYLLLAIPLKSYWQPLVIMSAIPFGIVGAILGHWFSGLELSMLSINGMLALSGVVVNDSLLLVNRFNQLRRAGEDIRVAVVKAGSQRMRAILLTSVTTCVGLLSLLQETSRQAQFLIPPATSLAYGILFATLISLILVPVLLLIAYDLSSWLRVRRPLPGQSLGSLD